MRQKSIQIKKNIKYCIGKIAGAENSQIEQAIERAEVVSFDIFDTLVKRNVKTPEDVHDLVQKEYFRQTGINISDYRKIRMHSEEEARKNSRREEISLEDIFDFLSGVSDSTKKKLQEIEEEMELAVCCPDLRMKAVYEYAFKAGKRVIITSDMYLGEKFIKMVLHKCGYDNFEKLYLSSSYGLCKATGSIFDVIKTDYAAFQGKIMHIGDNVKSDYFMPRRKGVEALLIDGQRNLLRYWDKSNKKMSNPFLYGRLYSFLNNHIEDDKNDAVHIAYEVLGPMLLGYCIWLNDKIKRDKIEKIFFLSREGKILQEAYNILYPHSKIPQTYLFVSRQALIVPLLAEANDFDEMIEVLKVFLHVPVLKTISILCGLDQKKFKEKLVCIGLNEETKIHEISDKAKSEVYHIIQEMGGAGFNQQKRYILKYLEENDFSGNIAIVDIGWAGTMQMTLQQYVKESGTVLRGYYFGVRNMETDAYYVCFKRNGYLFEPGKDKDFDLMMRFTTEIFEILLLNRTGSVQKYSLEKKRIVPVLAEPEYIGNEGAYLKSIQSMALSFINIIKKDAIFQENLDLPADIPMESYAHFAVYPRIDVINLFERFCFFTDGDVRKFIPDHGFFYYIFHFQDLKRDLNKSLCKIFFLKKVFKLSFPYFKVLRLLVVKCNVRSEFRKRYYITKENEDYI